jgi:hypothetical protein
VGFKPGARLYSQVDATEVIVVRPPVDDAVIACGGHPMTDRKVTPEASLIAAGAAGSGLLLGKRYTLAGDNPVELLVTKSGSFGVTIDGRTVAVKEAKPLPASD